LSEGTLRKDALIAEQKAMRFMLAHKLFRSDKTDQIINEAFTLFSLKEKLSREHPTVIT